MKKRKYLWLMVLSGILISLDQMTKIWVHTQFELGESHIVIPQFFNITYVRNFGAAFGILSESHPTFREIFFLTMPPGALLLILWLLRSVDDDDRIQIFALSSIFAGAIGNYIDRMRFRYVIDFLEFHVANQWSWPAFNIADSSIVIGVTLMFVTIFLQSKNEKKAVATSKS